MTTISSIPALYATPVDYKGNAIPQVRFKQTGKEVASIVLSGHKVGEEMSPMQWASFLAASPKLLQALQSASEFVDQCSLLMNTGNLGKFEEMFGAGVLASYQQEIQDALAKATGAAS